MARGMNLRSVFCYAYLPLASSAGPQDGGFSVNVYDNDCLTMTAFDAYRRPTAEFAFQMQTGVYVRLLEIMDRERVTLGNCPPRMAAGGQPGSVSMLGFDGHPMLQMEDFATLLDCPYRSIRGHYARRIYTLMEEISGLLAGQGFTLRLDGFGWDSRRVRMLPQGTNAGQVRYG